MTCHRIDGSESSNHLMTAIRPAMPLSAADQRHAASSHRNSTNLGLAGLQGEIVVMDNLPVRKVAGSAEDRLEARAELSGSGVDSRIE
jgi:hypothetical protein